MGTVDQGGNYRANENFLAEINGQTLQDEIGRQRQAENPETGKPEDHKSEGLVELAIAGLGAIVSAGAAFIAGGSSSSNGSTSSPNSQANSSITQPARRREDGEEVSDLRDNPDYHNLVADGNDTLSDAVIVGGKKGTGNSESIEAGLHKLSRESVDPITLAQAGDSEKLNNKESGSAQSDSGEVTTKARVKEIIKNQTESFNNENSVNISHTLIEALVVKESDYKGFYPDGSLKIRFEAGSQFISKLEEGIDQEMQNTAKMQGQAVRFSKIKVLYKERDQLIKDGKNTEEIDKTIESQKTPAIKAYETLKETTRKIDTLNAERRNLEKNLNKSDMDKARLTAISVEIDKLKTPETEKFYKNSEYIRTKLDTAKQYFETKIVGGKKEDYFSWDGKN